MRKAHYVILSWLLLASLVFSAAFPPAARAADWEITIHSNINADSFISNSMFIAGAKSDSSDGMDIYDARVVEAPSYSTPIFSSIDSAELMQDYRKQLLPSEEKRWDITQKGSMEFMSGGEYTEVLSWDISSIPDSISLHLIDYGSDAARLNIVSDIDMKSNLSSSFSAALAYGSYRYFSIMAREREASCIESWICSEWTPPDCTGSPYQSRVCTDVNNCSTSFDMPQIYRQCQAVTSGPRVVSSDGHGGNGGVLSSNSNSAYIDNRISEAASKPEANPGYPIEPTSLYQSNRDSIRLLVSENDNALLIMLLSTVFVLLLAITLLLGAIAIKKRSKPRQ